MSTDATGDVVFARRLKEVRELRGLSQGDLAQRIGILPAGISHLETGRRAPSLLMLKRLADTLSVTIDYLTGRSDDPAGAETQAVGNSPAAVINRTVKTLPTEQQEWVARMVTGLSEKRPQPSGAPPS